MGNMGPKELLLRQIHPKEFNEFKHLRTINMINAKRDAPHGDTSRFVLITLSY